jgi:hypothetical protein
MKRALLGLAAAATAITVLASAGPASAATGQVMQSKFVGPQAAALWTSFTATSDTLTIVGVDQDHLVVFQGTDTVDSSGNRTGATATIANVTSGFSFAIDKAHLSTASTGGSGIPATTCTFDANGNEINCTPTTIDLTVTWIGYGPSSHQVFNDHANEGCFRFSSHISGTIRSATTTGTLDGSLLGGLVGGDLAFESATTTDLFVGC